MSRNSGGTKKKRKVSLRFLVVALAAFLIYAGFTFFDQQARLNRIHNEQLEVNKAMEQVQNEIDLLESKVKYTESDEFIEGLARERLGWVKEGETRYLEKE
ncbi:MAG: FtsB family cell division protein [Christensenellales bacterium]